MHNLLFGLIFHSVIFLNDAESRKIGLATSNSGRRTKGLLSNGSKQSERAQKKQELLGQDTVRLNEAEYKLQSLVSPEFHESSKYFQKPFKQIGDLQMDMLSPAQVNFVQTASLWPHYAEPKENHQGTLYPENPVPFPISKNTAENDDHDKPWWDPSVADSFSRADLGSPQKSYEGDLQGDKSWWGSNKGYSDTPIFPSSNVQSYPTEDDTPNFPKEAAGSPSLQDSPNFADGRATNQMAGNMEGNRGNFPQMVQGKMISATGRQDGSVEGENFLVKGEEQNVVSRPEDGKPGLFGGQSPLFGSSNSLTSEQHLWSGQVKDEKQGILQGLQEAASVITGEEKGQDLPATPEFGDEDTKANARSFQGIDKIHASHTKSNKLHVTKNDKSITRKDEGQKSKTGRLSATESQSSKLTKLTRRFQKLNNGHLSAN